MIGASLLCALPDILITKFMAKIPLEFKWMSCKFISWSTMLFVWYVERWWNIRKFEHILFGFGSSGGQFPLESFAKQLLLNAIQTISPSFWAWELSKIELHAAAMGGSTNLFGGLLIHSTPTHQCWTTQIPILFSLELNWTSYIENIHNTQHLLLLHFNAWNICFDAAIQRICR